MEDFPARLVSANDADSLVEFKKQVQGAVESLRQLQGSGRVDAVRYIQGVLQMIGPRLNLPRVESSLDQSPDAVTPSPTSRAASAADGLSLELAGQDSGQTRMEQRVARLEAALGQMQGENYRLQRQLKSCQGKMVTQMKGSKSRLKDHMVNGKSTYHELSSFPEGGTRGSEVNLPVEVLVAPDGGHASPYDPTYLESGGSSTWKLANMEGAGENGVMSLHSSPDEASNGDKTMHSVDGSNDSQARQIVKGVASQNIAPESQTIDMGCESGIMEMASGQPNVDDGEFEVLGNKKKRGPLGPQKKTVRHICRLCNRDFTHGRPFHRHLQQHAGHCPVSCRRCRQEFWNLPLLQHHQCQPQKERQPHPCPHCQSSFSNAKKRNVHVRLVHRGKSVARHFCPECGQGYVKKETLRRHLQEHAGINQICQKCSKTFGSHEDFFEHMAWHERMAPYVCPKCGIHISKHHCYLKHLAAHELYDCSHCICRFTQRRQLKSHLLDKHNIRMADNTSGADVSSDPPGGACDRDILPSPEDDSRSHDEHGGDNMMQDDTGYDDDDPGDEDADDLASPPTPDPPDTCQQTGDTVTDSTAPSAGEQASTMPSALLEPIYKCDLCNALFRRKASLEKHKKTFRHQRRQGITSFPQNHLCPRCGKSYHRRQDLQRHLRYHNEERPHACPHCPYRCQERANLRRHLALHFSQRQFMCDLCAAAFHCKKSLQSHVLFKHSDQRNFSCPDCSSSFKTQNSLQRHMKVHTKERSHQCDSCGASFHRLYNLRRHMKSVHGTDERLPPVKRVKVLDVPSGEEFSKRPVLMERRQLPASRQSLQMGCTSAVSRSGHVTVTESSPAVSRSARLTNPEQPPRTSVTGDVTTRSISVPSSDRHTLETRLITELTSVPVCCSLSLQPSTAISSHPNAQTEITSNYPLTHTQTSQVRLDSGNPLTLTFKPARQDTRGIPQSLAFLADNLGTFQSPAAVPSTHTNTTPHQSILTPTNNSKTLPIQAAHHPIGTTSSVSFQSGNPLPPTGNTVPVHPTTLPPDSSQMQSLLQQCYLSLAGTSSADASAARADSNAELYAAVPGLLQLMQQGNS